MASKNINLINSDDSLNKFKTLITDVIGDSVERFLKIKLNKAFLFDEIVSLITTTRGQTLEDYTDLDAFLGSKNNIHLKELQENKLLVETLQKEICELKYKLSDYETKKHVDLIIHDSVVVDNMTPNKEEYVKETECEVEAAEDDAEEEEEEYETEDETEDETGEEEEDNEEDEADEEGEKEEDGEPKDKEEDEDEDEDDKEEDEAEDEEEPEKKTNTQTKNVVRAETKPTEDSEEEEELFEIEIDGVTYFTNDEDAENGDVYEVIDGEPGKLVGSIKDGEIDFFNEK